MVDSIALVSATIAWTMTINIQHISISSHLFGENLPVQIFGWGINSRYGGETNELQRIVTRTITNENCRQAHNSQSWRVNDNNVCTLIAGGGGTCYGDEGGPMVYGNELIGIVSWHSHCSSGRVPDVFERVLPHRLWIRSHIGNWN